MNLTERNARIQVTIAGTPVTGQLFSSFSGGDISATTELVYSGNMDNGQNVSGNAAFSDITLTCPSMDTNVNWAGPLVGAVQTAASATVSVTPLDADKNPIAGAQMTYTGLIKTYTPPPMDASSSTGAKHSLVVAADTMTQS